jgi:hypothetical protein
MVLSEADLQRAGELAAQAPPLSAEQRERLRAILAVGPRPQDQDGTSDAA